MTARAQATVRLQISCSGGTQRQKPMRGTATAGSIQIQGYGAENLMLSKPHGVRSRPAGLRMKGRLSLGSKGLSFQLKIGVADTVVVVVIVVVDAVVVTIEVGAELFIMKGCSDMIFFSTKKMKKH
jgi:hypothetical protein